MVGFKTYYLKNKHLRNIYMLAIQGQKTVYVTAFFVSLSQQCHVSLPSNVMSDYCVAKLAESCSNMQLCVTLTLQEYIK